MVFKPLRSVLSPDTGVGALVLAALLGLLHAESFTVWGSLVGNSLEGNSGTTFGGNPSGVLQMLCYGALWLLVFQTLQHSTRRAIGVVWVFGAAQFCLGLWWLFVSMHEFGNLPGPLAALGVGLLSAFLALFLTLVLAVCFVGLPWLLGKFGKPVQFVRAFQNSALNNSLSSSPSSSLWFKALFAATATLIAELLRGTVLTGFPWLSVGYAHTDTLFALLAPWVGVYGIGFVAAFVAVALALWVQQLWGQSFWQERSTLGGAEAKRLAAWALMALTATAVAAWGLHALNFKLTRATPALRVDLLQGNVPQNLKFNQGLQASLAWYHEQLLKSDAHVVVTPETAVPLLPQQLAQALPNYLPSLVLQAQQRRQAFLLGLPLTQGAPELKSAPDISPANSASAPVSASTSASDNSAAPTPERYTNSAVGIVPRQTYRYDKTHLVPFGEVIPTGFAWFVRLMQIPLGEFGRGAAQQEPLYWQGQAIMPNICYEDLFGEELARQFVGDLPPTVLVNMSNIAWFGNTRAIPQHLHISRMRAMELQRPMLRATNTGATAHINAGGRLQAVLPPYTQGVLGVSVTGRQGLTPFAYWASRWGLWPLWLWAGLCCLGLGFMGRGFIGQGAKGRSFVQQGAAGQSPQNLTTLKAPTP